MAQADYSVSMVDSASVIFNTFPGLSDSEAYRVVAVVGTGTVKLHTRGVYIGLAEFAAYRPAAPAAGDICVNRKSMSQSVLEGLYEGT
jgi:gamma-glutamyl phosphate reductase